MTVEMEAMIDGITCENITEFNFNMFTYGINGDFTCKCFPHDFFTSRNKLINGTVKITSGEWHMDNEVIIVAIDSSHRYEKGEIIMSPTMKVEFSMVRYSVKLQVEQQ